MLQLPAANLLFFYWPSLNPTSAERKDIADRFRYFFWVSNKSKKITGGFFWKDNYAFFLSLYLAPPQLTKRRTFSPSLSLFSLYEADRGYLMLVSWRGGGMEPFPIKAKKAWHFSSFYHHFYFFWSWWVPKVQAPMSVLSCMYKRN